MFIKTQKDIEDLCKKEKLSKKQIKEKYNDVLDDYSKMLLSTKPVRSWSGVLVITVVMRPDKFSCPHNCHYCPNEPGQPRSYLSSEPAVARANENNFDPVKQMHHRLNMLKKNGHNEIDKLEIIVLGGTFSAYPRTYQTEFITNLYYAANIYDSNVQREKQDLFSEQKLNETNKYKIIGISLETRPDHINKFEIKRLRNYGCTRVQIGVQHINDEILKYINRGHTNEVSIKAIKYLKNNGFKVDIHIMPDLPQSNPTMDKFMLETIQTSPNYSPDYLKIYPCLDVDFTVLKKWKEEGLWKPYSEENIKTLVDVILHAKKHSQYFIRYNRIQRDFPESKNEIVGYNSETIKTNLRQIIQQHAKRQNIECKCIRCCEIKGKSIQNTKKLKMNTDTYKASEGIEKFISYTSDNRRTLHGFIRLRFNDNDKYTCFNSLLNTALIRELHVYGFLKSTHKLSNSSKRITQHHGFGKVLLCIAELYSVLRFYKKIAVISGVGVRKYYEKYDYKLCNDGKYMIKNLYHNNNFWIFVCFWYLTRVIYYHCILCFRIFLLQHQVS